MSFENVLIVLSLVSAAAGLWGVFVKAGRKGWKALLPIYNIFVLMEILGWSKWWLILAVIPGVNGIFYIACSAKLLEVFGWKSVFWLFLFLFTSPFFLLAVGFGDEKYIRPTVRKRSAKR